MKKFLMFLSLIIILFLISLVLYGNYEINKKIDKHTPIKINIPKGTGINGIVKIFNNQGLAEPEWLYKFYLKYLSLISKKYFQAGVYLFPDEISMFNIINSLISGDNLYTAKVTFPEGISYYEFASILKSKALIDSVEFIRLAESDSLLKSREISAKNIEGYLLPDTYEFYMESKAKDIIDKLLDAHDNFYNRVLSLSANKHNLTKHQVLTLSSIVEAETPEDDERARVAGLYLNRLNKNMLLQADPTVAYSLGRKKRLLYDDLKVDNPYNTYKYLGLPPGPINNPGARSIRATLNAEEHNYFYMVSVGDGSNQHNFATNYNDHLKYVSEYRKRIKEQNAKK